MHERFSMGSRVGLLLAALNGCGKAVDLDRPGHAVLNTDPTVLATVEDWVVQVATDDRRLYWSTDAGALRGCEIDDCAGSVTTYAESEVKVSAGVVLQGGELFFAARSGDSFALVAAELDEPTRQRRVLDRIQPTALAVDERGACFSDEHFIRCFPLSAEAKPMTMHDVPGRALPRLALHGEYAYWLALADERGVLQRARRDGAGQVQTLSGQLRLDDEWAYTNPPSFGLEVDGQHVYFSENVLAGSVWRCPLDGCGSAPERLLTAVRFPSGLLLDGQTLYIEHETDAYMFTLSSCRVPDCVASAVTERLATKQAFVVGRNHVYAATTRQSLAPENLIPTPPDDRPDVESQLRRFPR